MFPTTVRGLFFRSGKLAFPFYLSFSVSAIPSKTPWLIFNVLGAQLETLLEYQTQLPSHQEKAVNDTKDAELFHPAQNKLEKSKYMANALFLPSVYNVSHSGDPRKSHSYMWFLRAILRLNCLKVSTRADVEGPWKEIGERKAALNPDLSSAFEKFRYVRQYGTHR